MRMLKLKLQKYLFHQSYFFIIFTIYIYINKKKFVFLLIRFLKAMKTFKKIDPKDVKFSKKIKKRKIESKNIASYSKNCKKKNK